jgi:hypothetical protein
LLPLSAPPIPRRFRQRSGPCRAASGAPC